MRTPDLSQNANGWVLTKLRKLLREARKINEVQAKMTIAEGRWP
jgi:hypothetical protein